MSHSQQSCLYEGRIDHRRLAPTSHEFGYRMFMLYLDLDELDRVFAGRWLWSVGRTNLASWRRQDYLGAAETPLKQAVRDLAEQEIGRRPRGPIRMLTHLRYFGFCFNPVTFYYCFGEDGEAVECVVAEITNTPWKERHAYVLDARRAALRNGDMLEWSFNKVFHVSPFFGMEFEYTWHFGLPGEDLRARMQNHRDGAVHFDASLRLERREITGSALARTLAAHPFMTGKVVAAIYWQALRLWLKRVPFHAHPKHATETTA